MSSPGSLLRNVVILAPMPLEMDAIVTAFGLAPVGDEPSGPQTGRVGASFVTAIHTGMGPPLTRVATARLFDSSTPGYTPVDHVMVAGICGGLDPDLDVGRLVNPETLVDHASGATYRHRPPGDAPVAGKLVMTEGVSLDKELSLRFFDEGCIAVDMESAAVAEVCEASGCSWSVYRCIGDRHFDGLLDERIIALSNPDGSGNREAIAELLAREPEVRTRLSQLAHDSSLAAKRAAEAAVRGCLALDHA